MTTGLLQPQSPQAERQDIMVFQQNDNLHRSCDCIRPVCSKIRFVLDTI